jgi:hypothetical protein
MDFDKKTYDCEDPLGPMKDAQAKMLEGLLQTRASPAEDRRLCWLVTPKAPTEVMDGERAVSWITAEEIDREGEIVVARGMNDAQFNLNPIVTMNHAHGCPPVGRSLWRKRAKDGPLVGVKAERRQARGAQEARHRRARPAGLRLAGPAGADRLHVRARNPPAIERRIAGFDFERLAKRAIDDGINRARGRV